MAKASIVINSSLSAAELQEKLEQVDNSKGAEGVQSIINFLRSLKGGFSHGDTVKLETGIEYASGTVTLASVDVADTVTVDGVVFTAVASGATGDQFNQGGSDTVDAASLVSAINANTTLDGRVLASNVAGVVTITALYPGELGNSVSLASSNGTRLAVSAAALAGGSNDSSSKSFTL